MKDEFRAELRNLIRFMNSEDVEIDEKRIKQFYDEFPFEERGTAYKNALDELDREIWAAIKELGYIDSMKMHVEGNTTDIWDTRKGAYPPIESLDETTQILCKHIDELIMKKAFKRAETRN